MSIASEITRIKGKVADSFTACGAKGATIPESEVIANLPTCIDSIPTGSSAVLGTKSITANGTYNAVDDSLDGYSAVTVDVPTGGGLTALGEKSLVFADTVNAGDKIYAHAVDIEETTLTGTVPYTTNYFYNFNGVDYVFSCGGSPTYYVYIYKVIDGALVHVANITRSYGYIRSIMSIGEHLYVMLGSGNTSYHNLIIYEVLDSSITQKISFTPSYSGNMTASGIMINFNGELYVLSNYTNYATNLVKIDTATWTCGTEYRTPTYATIASAGYSNYIVFGDNLYLAHGSNASGAIQFNKFNPTAETPLQSLPAVDIAPTHNCTTTAFSITDGSLFCVAANASQSTLYKIENDTATYKDESIGATNMPVLYDDNLNIGILAGRTFISIKNSKFIYSLTTGSVNYNPQFNVVDNLSRKIGTGSFCRVSNLIVTQQKLLYGKARAGADVGGCCGVAKTGVMMGDTGVMTVNFAAGGVL